MLLLLAAFALAWWARGWSPLYMTSAVVVGLSVGLMNISFGGQGTRLLAAAPLPRTPQPAPTSVLETAPEPRGCQDPALR